MYRTVFWTLGEGEGGMIWENGTETCIISYKKRIASLGSMLGAGALGKLISYFSSAEHSKGDEMSYSSCYVI